MEIHLQKWADRWAVQFIRTRRDRLRFAVDLAFLLRDPTGLPIWIFSDGAGAADLLARQP